MKKIIGLLMIVALMMGCAFSTISRFSGKYAEGKENIVPNSSFEMGSNQMPEGWVVLNETENNIIWDDDLAKNGSKSLKINAKKSGANLVSDEFVIDPLSVYYSRCYIKAQKPSDKPVTIHFIAFNKNGKKVNDYKKEVKLVSDWTLVELTTGFFDGSATYARIAVSIPEDEKENIYWVDDIESYNVHKLAYRFQTD
jgi:hypothetical protein